MVKASEGLIRILVDAGKDSKLFDKYGIRSMPNFVALDPEGNKVHSGSPTNSVPGLVSLFQDLVEKHARGPKYVTTIDEAMAFGKEDRKLVVLVFVDEKPKTLQFLKTFGDAAYKESWAGCAVVKLPFTKDDETCKTWSVTESPTILLIDGSADEPKVLKTIKGAKAPKDLKKDLDEAAKKVPAK